MVRRGLTLYIAGGEAAHMWIHFCDGKILNVPNVTSFQLDTTSLVLYIGEKIAGRFSRRDIFYCGDILNCPSPA
jgi:hypothetical protein